MSKGFCKIRSNLDDVPGAKKVFRGRLISPDVLESHETGTLAEKVDLKTSGQSSSDKFQGQQPDVLR